MSKEEKEFLSHRGIHLTFNIINYRNNDSSLQFNAIEITAFCFHLPLTYSCGITERNRLKGKYIKVCKSVIN